MLLRGQAEAEPLRAWQERALHGSLHLNPGLRDFRAGLSTSSPPRMLWWAVAKRGN